MIPGLIFLILIATLVLIKAADMVVVAIRRVAKEMHTPAYVISVILLALATSFPELFVGITSALEGSSNLSLGVVLGSNIANIGFIGSIAAFIAGHVNVHGDYLKRDIWISFFAGLLPLLLVADGSLGKVDGLILVSVYLAYATGFFRKRYEEIGREHQQESFVYRFFRRFHNIESVRPKEYARLFVGIALLLFSADIIVKLSQALAAYANIPIFVVGLFVIAVGTSLPELAFSIRSIEDHEPSMFFGNLLGSTIANSTLIIGVTSIIAPIEVTAFSQYLTAAVFFVAIYLIFWFFTRSKSRLDRWEAGLLILLYFSFFILEIIE